MKTWQVPAFPVKAIGLRGPSRLLSREWYPEHAQIVGFDAGASCEWAAGPEPDYVRTEMSIAGAGFWSHATLLYHRDHATGRRTALSGRCDPGPLLGQRTNIACESFRPQPSRMDWLMADRHRSNPEQILRCFTNLVPSPVVVQDLCSPQT